MATDESLAEEGTTGEPELTPLQAALNHAEGNARQADTNLAYIQGRFPPGDPTREAFEPEFLDAAAQATGIVDYWRRWVKVLTAWEDQFDISISALTAHGRAPIDEQDLRDLANLPPDQDELTSWQRQESQSSKPQGE